MSKNPYLAASRPTSSFTRSSRSSKRNDFGSALAGRSGVTSSLLARSRSSAGLAAYGTAARGTNYLASSQPSSWSSRASSASRYSPQQPAPPPPPTTSTTTNYVQSKPEYARDQGATCKPPDEIQSASQMPKTSERDSERKTAEKQPVPAAGSKLGLYKSISTHNFNRLYGQSLSQDDDDDEDDESDDENLVSASSHLQNYQQSKMNQPSAQVKARSSFQSLDSATSATNSPSGSIDLARSSQATSSDSLIQADEQSELARKQLAAAERTSNIPSGAKSQLQQQQLHKSRSLEIERQRRDSSPPLLHSSMSVDRLILRSESMGERDLRKSFKELVLENDKLRRQLVELRDQDNSSTKHNQPDDWTRRERQLQRKISELEEESKQLDQLRLEIQRLKDENSSLIRVVSKLSKQQQQKQY